ncbi:MAG: RbcX chaperonin protein [Acaryochloridaceae cyanobacterium SU_2_1]|nr:RbcX chaperonin protein [Acaryochloridaceae cyanobacterium SU_2_1]NJM95445.1 RbcX chaperonin protein [Acaryochloridaceae cyanobacterium CSU_5_19]
MDYKQVAKNTAKMLISYLTYQAARTVVSQLYETNPALGIWLSEFSSVDRIQDGEIYLTALMKENPELALRLMTVRADLAEGVVEYLPEMAKIGIQQANTELRRQLLERMTQMRPQEASPSHPEGSDQNPLLESETDLSSDEG